jgi:hypothetical protein
VEVVDPGEVCGFLPMASSNQSVEGKQPDEQAGGSVPPGVQQMAPDNGWTRAHFRVFDDREVMLSHACRHGEAPSDHREPALACWAYGGAWTWRILQY